MHDEWCYQYAGGLSQLLCKLVMGKKSTHLSLWRTFCLAACAWGGTIITCRPDLLAGPLPCPALLADGCLRASGGAWPAPRGLGPGVAHMLRCAPPGWLPSSR
jgi:hypothetical protein